MPHSKSIFEFSDYREYLLHVLSFRVERNTSYSMRAFSRDLGLRPAALTDVLNGRYGLSGAKARKAAENLKLNAEETAFLVGLVEMRHARSVAARDAAFLKVRKMRTGVGRYQNLHGSQVNLFSTWFQPAILELITINGDRLSEDQIARSLDLSPAEVRKALEHLVQLGALSREQDHFVRNQHFVIAESPNPSEVIRGFHKQILAKARDALDEQTMEMRKSLSSVFSFKVDQIATARTELEILNQAFADKFGSPPTADSVYALSIQFFRLDTREKALP